jgi:hypothetical protein
MLTFSISDPEPSDHTRLLEFRISDGQLRSSPATTQVNVVTIDDNCPEIQLGGNIFTYTEGDSLTSIISPNFNITDADDPQGYQVQEVQISINAYPEPSSVQLNFTVISPVQSTEGDNNSYVLTGPAPTTTFSSILRTLRFELTSQEPTGVTARIRITALDTQGSACSSNPISYKDITVVIDPVNDNAAVLQLNSPQRNFSTSYEENGLPIDIAGNVFIADADEFPDMRTINYTLTITLLDGCSDIDTFEEPSCSHTFTGDYIQIESFIDSVKFSSSADDHVNDSRVIEFILINGDFQEASYTTVSITPVNDRPVVDLSAFDDTTNNAMKTLPLDDPDVNYVSIVGDGGVDITDPDSSSVTYVTLEIIEVNSSDVVVPRTGPNPALTWSDSLQFVVSGGQPQPGSVVAGITATFDSASGILTLQGPASHSDFEQALNSIVYVFEGFQVERNTRRIEVLACEAACSLPTYSYINLEGVNHAPTLDCNGNSAGDSNAFIYSAGSPALFVCPDLSISEIDEGDGHLINRSIITIEGPAATCSSLDVSIATHSAISQFEYLDGNVTTYDLRSSPEGLLTSTFSDILRRIRFVTSQSVPGATCTVTFTVYDDLGAASNPVTSTISILAYNNPPFIDPDLGAPGISYFTEFIEKDNPIHIVSRLNATLRRNIPNPVTFGEAGEAPLSNLDPLTNLSYAGYEVSDNDGDDLRYLRISFVENPGRNGDLITFPCRHPSEADLTSFYRGCTNNGDLTNNTDLVFDGTFLSDCGAADNICDGLSVQIECPVTNSKTYEFRYSGNASVERYYNLLGCIGYQHIDDVNRTYTVYKTLDLTAADYRNVSRTAQTTIRLRRFIPQIIFPNVPDIEIYEDARPNETALCVLEILDADTVSGRPLDNVHYNITGGNIDDAFYIDNRGYIFLFKPLDRETTDSYNLTVQATSGESAANTTVYINVLDVNDNRPVTDPSFSANVSEGLTDAFVINIPATDRDLGTNSELVYSIVGYGSSYFRIYNNGSVYTRVPLNKDIQDSYTLVVIIADKGYPVYLQNYTILHVMVVPRFVLLEFNATMYTATVVENDPSLFVTQVFASEEGTGNTDQIFYRYISATPTYVNSSFDSLFTLDSSTGAISLVSPWDAETVDGDGNFITTIGITVEAYSTKTQPTIIPASTVIVITIQDVNDVDPVIICPAFITAQEDRGASPSLHTFSATDADATPTVNFTFFLSASSGAPISITPSGVLSVSGQLDFETTSEYVIEVCVTDHPPPGNTACCNVTFNITNIDDGAVNFIGDPYMANVRENATNGDVVVVIQANDEDEPPFNNVVYSTPDTDIPFIVNPTTGEISVSNSTYIDLFERPGPICFEVVATSNPSGISDNATVCITVDLINDNGPIFEPDNYTVACFREDIAINTTVVTVSATDADGGVDGRFGYYLNGVNVPFTVDVESGAVRTSQTLDYEVQTGYTLAVIAQELPDVQGQRQMDTAEVSICLIDLNDNAPVFPGAPYTTFLFENATNGHLVFKFGAVDADRTPENRIITYRLITANTPFSVVDDTLRVNNSSALDYDQGQRVYELDIEATNPPAIPGDATHVDTFRVTVILNNTNDHTPIFLGPFEIHVCENTPNSSVIATLTASDRDVDAFGTFFFSLADSSIACSPEFPFSVNMAGDVEVCNVVDYEVVGSTPYMVQMVVTDVGGLTDSRMVMIYVEDINDNDPVFQNPTFEVGILETVPNGFIAYTLDLTDADGPANRMMTISSSNIFSTPFSVVGNRIEVADEAAIDFDTGPTSYVIEVIVENVGMGSLVICLSNETRTVRQNITINILDVNEGTPVLLPPFEYSFHETNDKSNETLVGCLSATDTDAGTSGQITFNATPVTGNLCTETFPFSVVEDTAGTTCIYACSNSDYESGLISFTLSVVATDGGSPSLSSQAQNYTIFLIDVNDEPPVFNNTNLVYSIEEKHGQNTVIQLMVSDEDSDLNDVVYFEIAVSPLPSPFDVDNSTQTVFVSNSSLLDDDLLRSDEYSVSVTAVNPPCRSGHVDEGRCLSNDDTLFATQTFTISVIDCNDQPPVFSQDLYLRMLAEDAPNGHIVIELATSDADRTEANRDVEYIITTSQTPFEIANSSSFVVADSSLLDFDTDPTVYEVGVTALNSAIVCTSDTSQQETTTVTVFLEDVNDNDPVIVEPNCTYISESTTGSVTVATLSASDADSGVNQELTFSLDILAVSVSNPETFDITGVSPAPYSNCSSNSAFTVVPITGEIVLCGPLDRENVTSFIYQATAEDGSPTAPRTSSPVKVCIVIEDVNDNTPEFQDDIFAFEVSEDTSIGTSIHVFTVTDRDIGINGEIAFSLSTSTGGAECTRELPFAIDNEGNLTLCIGLDFETDSRLYEFQVYATDGGDPTNSAVQTVTVELTDFNDNFPMFNSTNTTSVFEEAADEFVKHVLAVDNDGTDVNSNVSYTIVGSSAEFHFEQPAAIGEPARLLTSVALDRETNGSYTIVIEACDMGTPQRCSRQELVISVLDIDDNDPVFDSCGYTYDEETAFLFEITYNDLDIGVNAVLTFTTITEPSLLLEANGTVISLIGLDRDPGTGGQEMRRFSINSMPQSGRSGIFTIMCTVNLTDINDNYPIFTSPQPIEIIESANSGERVDYVFSAVDHDKGSNMEVTFALVTEDDAISRTIDIQPNGEIFLRDEVRLLPPLFFLNVSATDGGGLVTYKNFTVVLTDSIPLWPYNDTSVSIEEVYERTLIANQPAADRDIVENDIFFYTVTSARPYGDFTMAGNGSLFIESCCLDAEDSTLFTLVVEVGPDNTTISDQLTLYITVNDSNDNAPYISPSQLAVSLEETVSASSVIVTITAIDIDSGDNSRLTYSLSGNDSNLFEFDSDGNLRLAGGASLDFETTERYVFYVTATDSGTPQRISNTATVTITIIDVDDKPPRFTQSMYPVNVSEDLIEGGTVVVVTLTDEDTLPDDITFSLDVVRGNVPQDQFEIVKTGSQQSLQGYLAYATVRRRAGSPELDRDAPNSGIIILRLNATDQSGLPPATTEVAITLIDIDDSPPSILPENSQKTFREGNSTVDFSGYSISDPDSSVTSPIMSFVVKLVPNSRFSGQSFPLDGGYSDYPQLNVLAGNQLDQLLGFEDASYPLSPYANDMNVVRPTDVLISTNIFDPRVSPNVTFFTYFSTNSLSSPRHVVSFTTANYSFSVEVSSTQLIITTTDMAAQSFNLPSTVIEEILSSLVELELRIYTQLGQLEICIRWASSVDNFSGVFSATAFANSAHLMVGSRNALNTYGQAVLFPRALTDDELLSLVRGGEYFTLSSVHSTVSFTENPFTRTLEVTYNGNDNAQSYAVMADALNSVVYHNDISEPQSEARSIELRAQDSTSLGPPSTLTITALLVDDSQPEADLNGLDEPGLDYSAVFRESANAVLIVSRDAIIYDKDSGESRISMVQLHVKGVNDSQATPSDLLEVTSSFPSDIQFDFRGLGLAYLSPAGNATSLQASRFTDAILAVTYRYNGTYMQPLTKLLYVTVMDAAGKMNSPLSTVTFSLTLVNDPPVLFGFSRVAFYLEAVGRVDILSGGGESIIDPDSTALSEARVTIENRLDGSSEYLEADSLNISGISITSEATTGKFTLIISGSGNFAAYLAILRTVVYVNTNRAPGDPVTTDRIISFEVVDDGDDFGTPSSRSEKANVTVQIEPLDDLAIVYLNHPNRDYQLSFQEDSECTTFVGDVQIIDIDGGRVEGAQITLEAADGDPNTVKNSVGVRFDGTTGLLEYIDTSAFEGLGTVVANGSVPGKYEIKVTGSNVQNLQELLRLATYCNYVDEPVFAPRLVTIEIVDPSDPLRTTYISTSNTSVVEANDIPEVNVTAQEEVAIRNRPTQIFASDQVELDDSDDSIFQFVKIYITNPQNTRAEETIVFEGNLPPGAVSVGPKTSDLSQYPNAYLFEVTFGTEGASQSEIIAIIQQIRYQNNATNVNEIVSREVCLVVSDFEDESNPTCVDIDLSASNLFAPTFANHSVTLSPITVEENLGRLLIDQQVATDNDTDSLASSVSYSISSVVSRTPSGASLSTSGFFEVDSDGQIFSNTLDAEMYTHHTITVQAEDRGNPILSSTIVVSVVVGDINDNAPSISVTTQGVFSDDSSPGITIASLTIVDPDVSSSNSQINTDTLVVSSPYIINGQPVFDIRDIVSQADGSVTATITNDQVLDREAIGNSASLVVSVADIQGTTGSATVTFTITDVPDTPPSVEQRTVAIYPVGLPLPRPTVSIGPAMYVDDGDVDPKVQSVEITLNPNANDASRTLSACGCQDNIFETCNLDTSGAINLLPLATLTPPGSTAAIGAEGSCEVLEIVRTGYATVPRSTFGSDAFTGSGYTFTFVAVQHREGYAFVFNEVEEQFYLGLWIRKTRIDVDYLYDSGSTTPTLETGFNFRNLEDIFDRDTAPTRERHWALTVDNVNQEIRLYLDCQLLGSHTLSGSLVDIPSTVDMTIGKDRLRSFITRGYEGNITDLYFHPRVLSPTEVNCLCTCGSERLVAPSAVPAGTTSSLTPNGLSLTLTNDDGLAASNMSQLLRLVQYENSIPNPTLGDRTIDFTATDVATSVGVPISATSSGTIRLVESDNAVPEIDVNSPIVSGLNYETTFNEGGDPVAVTDGGVDIRRGSIINPSIESLTITLTNPSGADSESLVYLPTETIEFLTVANNNSNSITFTGPGVVTDFEAAARSVFYQLTSNNPNITDRIVEFSVVDTEGRSTSKVVTTTISIDPINDPPSLTIPEGATVEFTEGSAPVTIATSVNITDPDSVNLQSATVSITQRKLEGDTLSHGSLPSGINGSYDPDSGVLQFSGQASLSVYKGILESVTFSSTQAPFLDETFSVDDNARRVSIVVTDSAGSTSTAVVQAVRFLPVNDPPTITINGATTATVQFVEGDPSADILIAANVSIEDQDNMIVSRAVLDLTNAQDQENLEFMILPNGIASRRLILSVRTISETVSDIAGTVYRNAADEPSLVERTIRIDVFDNEDNSATLIITIQFQTLNDHVPEFTQSLYMFSVDEDAASNTVINTVSATDSDILPSPSDFTYALLNTSVPFSLRGNTDTNDASLIVSGALNFEDASAYTLVVTVVDQPEESQSLTGTATIIVTVNDVPEAPVVDLSGDDDSTTNQSVRTRYAEGSGLKPVFVESISIDDQDVGGTFNSATIQITGIQNPGQESITVNGAPSGTFENITYQTTSGNTIVANGAGDASQYIRFLKNITYLNSVNNVGQRLTRTVTVVVTDNSGIFSNTAYMTILIANAPIFAVSTHEVNLVENEMYDNFLNVSASTGLDIPLTYSIQPQYQSILSVNAAGSIYLTSPLDYEVWGSPLTVEVYAVDTEEPPVSGTATIVITLENVDDEPPFINFTRSFSIALPGPTALFGNNLVLSDPDELPLSEVLVTVQGPDQLTLSPYVGLVCVDDVDVTVKLQQCGFNIDYVLQLHSLEVVDGDMVYTPGTTNLVLQNNRYAELSNLTELTYFETDTLNPFAFITWIKLSAGSSGYLASFSSLDGATRYFAAEYGSESLRFYAFFKHTDFEGLESLVRVVFQLSENTRLDDDKWHFVLVIYDNRRVYLFIDGERIDSSVVTYPTVVDGSPLPLQHDVQGPDSLSDTRFVVGGRITSGGGVDKLLPGEYVSTYLLTGVVVHSLGECMTSCSEDLQATLTHADITVDEFNVTERTLRLSGSSSAANYLGILRTLQYTNRATSANLDQFSFQVFDGAHTTNYNLPVSQQKKRKRSLPFQPAAPQPRTLNKKLVLPSDLSIKQPTSMDNAEQTLERKPRSLLSAQSVDEVPQEAESSSVWSLPVIVLSSATVVLALVVAWAVHRKSKTEDEMAV